MDDLVIGLIAGFAAAVVLMALIMFLSGRRAKARQAEEIQRYDASIVDLRQERAEDKETNRRLRHELVSQSPDRLVETANAAELERDSAVSERDQALEQLQLVQQDLTQAHGRIADREAKLRQYREALKEIRVALEAQDRGAAGSMHAANGLIGTDTGELLTGPADTMNSGDTVNPADTISPADTMNPVEAVDSVEAVDPLEAVDSVTNGAAASVESVVESAADGVDSADISAVD
ncbi:MAG: hypothetical protein ACRBK7_00585 [Acidimicrobiales bacterium]